MVEAKPEASCLNCLYLYRDTTRLLPWPWCRRRRRYMPESRVCGWYRREAKG